MSTILAYKDISIPEASKALHNKLMTVQHFVDYFVKNARAKNPETNAYLEIYDDAFINAQVQRAQEMIHNGTATMLTGIPFAIKDNIVVQGRIASAASKILEQYTATYTATAAQKLIDAGAVLIGRTNMDEFAMGGSTENSAFGPTTNAHDSTRVAGGSSGGSAVAVAADCAMAALGSDTGGSIRQPASFNGVVGLKPTYGAVSRYGLMAMASSLDVIGPIARSVADAQIVFDCIKGVDVKDATSTSGDISPAIKKIGVPRKYLEQGMDADALENFSASLRRLEKQGYQIIDIDLPHLQYSLAVYYTLMPAEVSSNMARYDGVKYGGKIDGADMVDDYFKTRGGLLGREVKRRIILGTYVLSAGYADDYYNKAWQVRNLLKQDFAAAFKTVDVIALPTSPTPAFKIGEKTEDPLQMYLADIFTIFVNLVGVPAISIPDGVVSRDGKQLPTSIQLIAPHLGEQRLFAIGTQFENSVKSEKID